MSQLLARRQMPRSRGRGLQHLRLGRHSSRRSLRLGSGPSVVCHFDQRLFPGPQANHIHKLREWHTYIQELQTTYLSFANTSINSPVTVQQLRIGHLPMVFSSMYPKLGRFFLAVPLTRSKSHWMI